MASRTIEVEGERWTVCLSGRVTNYSKDEVALVFELGTGDNSIRRICRFRPFGRAGTVALADLSDAFLKSLLNSSQPAWTSPELDYGKSTRTD